MTVLAGDLIIACVNFVAERDGLFWRRYLGVVGNQEIDEITNENPDDGNQCDQGRRTQRLQRWLDGYVHVLCSRSSTTPDVLPNPSPKA
jgi:hypothetical protein